MYSVKCEVRGSICSLPKISAELRMRLKHLERASHPAIYSTAAKYIYEGVGKRQPVQIQNRAGGMFLEQRPENILNWTESDANYSTHNTGTPKKIPEPMAPINSW